MAFIQRFSAKDAVGQTGLGRAGETVTALLTFDEALVVSQGTINLRTVRPSFVIGALTIASQDIQFLDFNPSSKTMRYQIKLPSEVNDQQITLAGLSITDITLTGLKSGQPMRNLTQALTARYQLDNTAPAWVQPTENNATITLAENNRQAFATVVARDNVAQGLIRYQLAGADAEHFLISNSGVLRAKVGLDFETRSLYQFSVIASDIAGNSTQRAVNVQLKDLDEPVVLAKGLSTKGRLLMIKGAEPPSNLPRSVVGDFVDDEAGKKLSYSVNQLPTGLTLSNGTLTGNAQSAGNYAIVVTARDGQSSKGVSRAYELSVLDKPAVSHIQVSDIDPASASLKTGREGDRVMMKVYLSEALQQPAPSGIQASFVGAVNAQWLEASTENGQTVLKFSATLPAGNSTRITLTSLTLPADLIGTLSGGRWSAGQYAIQVSDAYVLDNSSPKWTSPAAVNVQENMSAGSVVYQAKSSDGNAVRYSLQNQGDAALTMPDGQRLFSIHPSTGALTLHAPLNYEDPNNLDRRYQINVIATDINGNPTMKMVQLNVKDVNEATQMKTGILSTGRLLTFIQNASFMRDGVAADFVDPERKSPQYRISDGWLAPGLKLNARTGQIEGKPLHVGEYQFSVTADDKLDNGQDASRLYRLKVQAEPVLLSAVDTELNASESKFMLNTYGPFKKGGKLALYQGERKLEETVLASNNSLHTINLDKTKVSEALQANETLSMRYTAPKMVVPLFSNRLPIHIDNSPPSISTIQFSAQGEQNGWLNADNDRIVIKLTFSEAVSMSGAPSLRLQLGNTQSFSTGIATFSGLSDQRVAQFEYRIQADDEDLDGVALLDVGLATANTPIADLVGNPASTVFTGLNTNASFKIDTQMPSMQSIAISSDATVGRALRSGNILTCAVTFSESIITSASPSFELRLGDATISASLRDITQDSVANFIYTIAATDATTQSIAIPQNGLRLGLKDLAGNPASSINPALSKIDIPEQLSIDNTPPVLARVEIDGASGVMEQRLNQDDVLTIAAVFNENVTVDTTAGKPSIELNVGGQRRNAVYQASGSHATRVYFTYTIQAGDNDSMGVSIAAGRVQLNNATIQDLAGNTLNTTTFAAVGQNDQYRVDTSAPGVPSITLSGVANTAGWLNEGKIITASVRYDEAIQQAPSSNPTLRLHFDIDGSSVTRLATWQQSQANVATFFYTVQAGDQDANGVSVPSHALSQGITDLAGNPASTANVLTQDQSSFKVDTQAPSVAAIRFSSSGLSNGFVNADDALTATVSFTEQVNISATPTLQMVIGSTTYSATTQATSGNTANFVITIAATDNDNDGVQFLRLSAGTVEDLANNAWRPSVTSFSDSAIKVDTTAPSLSPTISLSASQSQNNRLNDRDVITASLTFNEAVAVSGTPSIQLDIGGLARTATWQASAMQSSVMQFVYTIQAEDSDNDGLSIPVGAIDLNGGRISDLAGNALPSSAFHSLANQTEFQVDSQVPAVTSIQLTTNNPTGAWLQSGDVVTAAVSFSEQIASSGSPSLRLLFGQDSERYTRNMRLSHISADVAYFVYTMQATDVAAQRLFAPDNSITVGITDLAGNAADLISPIIDYRPLAQGFLISGQSANEFLGTSVAAAGDVNGDGLADLLIGADFNNNGIGRSYLVYGKANGSVVHLSSLALGRGGFQILGENHNDNTGGSVSSAGDVNGDGLADLLIGANRGDVNNLDNRGKTYVVFGGVTAAIVQLSNIANGSGGFVVRGECAGDESGYSVAAAGDINGDGLADLLIGARENDAVGTAAGRSYVVYGKTSGQVVNLSSISAGSGGFIIQGQCSGDQSGIAVASAGDVNGDGLMDLVIGASQARTSAGSSSGNTYVVFGQTHPSAIALSAIALGSGGFVIQGQAQGELSGGAIASAGDINGDGLADLVIGARLSDPAGSIDAGRSYVVWGKTNTQAAMLSDVAAGTGGFVINGECSSAESGFSVSAAGDVNGDGWGDLFIGAPKHDQWSGRGYVIFGKNAMSEVHLSNIANGSGGFVINNVDNYSRLGEAVSAAGDVNGDGLADLILGAPLYPDGNRLGRSFVIFGKTDNKPVNVVDIAQASGSAVIHDHAPLASADRYVGTTASEVILGGMGNDTLIGGGGADVILGGGDADVIVVNASNIAALTQAPSLRAISLIGNIQAARWDGGSGIDTLQLAEGAHLDLTAIKQLAAGHGNPISRIASLEKIDLASDSASNTLSLDVMDVVDMAAMNLFNASNGWNALGTTVARHQMLIQADSNDRLIWDSGAWEKRMNGSSALTVQNDSKTYEIWNHRHAAAQLIIQQGVPMSDRTGPSLRDVQFSASNAQNGFVKANDVVTISLFFSEAIQTAATPTLNMHIGNRSVAATFSALTTDQAQFFYTVLASDHDSNGLSLPANAVTGISDTAGNSLRNHVATLEDGRLKVDNIAPSIPSLQINDSGVSDGKSLDGRITVLGLDSDAVWQYQVTDSLSNRSAWMDGQGNTFNASLGNNRYQVRQTDLAGNRSLSAIVNLDLRFMRPGFLIQGECSGDMSGAAVAAAGDINGDGLSDWIVGAYLSNAASLSNVGRSYVVFGSSQGNKVDLSAVANGTGGFVIRGQCAGEDSGFALSGAGDVNGDGLSDLIIGAPTAIIIGAPSPFLGQQTRSYLVHGKTSSSPVELSNIAAGSGGFVINGEAAGDRSGFSVAGTGDINGDGLADLLVGAYLSDIDGSLDVGRAYVVFGTTDTKPIDLSGLASASAGFVMIGLNANDKTGLSVAAAGDVNGDGFGDFILSTLSQVDAPRVGRSYVVFGGQIQQGIALSDIVLGTGGFIISGQAENDQIVENRYSVSAAGDVNGDGLADIMVAESMLDANGTVDAGRSYVIFGKTSGGEIQLSNLGSRGFVILGHGASESSGTSIAAAGDVNGDGLGDLIIGAPYNSLSPAGEQAGRSYVVFGKNNSNAVNLSAVVNGTGGFVIHGLSANTLSGFSVSAAGDVNADGLADVIIGSSDAAGIGRSFVVYGKNDNKPVWLSALATGNGDLVQYAFVGDANNNRFTGTSASEIILGGAGDDELSSGGGADVLLGGAGDDVLEVNASFISALAQGPSTSTLLGSPQLARLDGGSGIDSLQLSQGAHLNLSPISQIAAGTPHRLSRISQIESIDMATDSAANTLTLGALDVMDMTAMNVFIGNDWEELGSMVSKHQLLIKGNAASGVGANQKMLDVVDIDTTVWSKQLVQDSDTVLLVSHQGSQYEIWNHQSAAAQLIIQVGVSVI